MKWRNESGFTLIELLIVVGIVVALAEAVVPHLAQTSDAGAAVEKANEREAIQTAFENVMSEIFIPTIPQNTGQAKVAVNSWATQPTGGKAPLYPRYFSHQTSTYFYCWASSGQITYQRTSPSVCLNDD